MTDGRRVVELALRHLTEMSPSFASKFRSYQNFRYANAGGQLHWGIATQRSTVSNPQDDTGTPLNRVAAQLTIDASEASDVLAALLRERAGVEQAMGRRLSWLDGGDNNRRQRALVRSWRELAGDEDGLAIWLATEVLRLRAVLRPLVVRLGYDIP